MNLRIDYNFQEKKKKQEKKQKKLIDLRTFCITGTIPTMSRVTAVKKLQERGMVFHNSINALTRVLITGEKVGQSKLDTARKSNNITVVSYEEFPELRSL